MASIEVKSGLEQSIDMIKVSFLVLTFVLKRRTKTDHTQSTDWAAKQQNLKRFVVSVGCPGPQDKKYNAHNTTYSSYSQVFLVARSTMCCVFA